MIVVFSDHTYFCACILLSCIVFKQINEMCSYLKHVRESIIKTCIRLYSLLELLSTSLKGLCMQQRRFRDFEKIRN